MAKRSATGCCGYSGSYARRTGNGFALGSPISDFNPSLATVLLLALVSPQLSLALSFFLCQMDGLDEETLLCLMSCMGALALPGVCAAAAPFL